MVMRRWISGIAVAAACLSLGACGSSSTKSGTATTLSTETIRGPVITVTPTSLPATTATVPPTTVPPTTVSPSTVPPTTVPSLTPAQQNAIQTAKSYLAEEAFSRLGLIQQLSSSAGSGYPMAVATFAVDSLDENWDAQAAKAAKEYLSEESFSCSGLVQQLDSSAGSQFTATQAQYGVKSAGIC